MDIKNKLEYLRNCHEDIVWEIADYFNLDEYQMLWVAWAEGFILGLLLWWIF
jgi:hypothetical protein